MIRDFYRNEFFQTEKIQISFLHSFAAGLLKSFRVYPHLAFVSSDCLLFIRFTVRMSVLVVDEDQPVILLKIAVYHTLNDDFRSLYPSAGYEFPFLVHDFRRRGPPSHVLTEKGVDVIYIHGFHLLVRQPLIPVKLFGHLADVSLSQGQRLSEIQLFHHQMHCRPCLGCRQLLLFHGKIRPHEVSRRYPPVSLRKSCSAHLSSGIF